jgi:hypothetical protein
MTKILTLSLVVLMLLGLGAVRSHAETYPTNIQLVEQTVKAAVASMKVAPTPGQSHDLEMEAGTGSDAAWLVENILKEKLIGMGWAVKAKQANPDSASGLDQTGFVLKMRIADLGLIYGKSWRRYVIVGKRVERIARVSIFYELVDKAGGTINTTSNASAELRDKVPVSQLAALSDSKYPFASPVLEKSQWDRYVEGGLVIAIVGVLVYLFYSNKTAS